MYKTCRHQSRLAVAEQPHGGEHSLPGTAPFSPGQEAALLPAAAWLDSPEGQGAAGFVHSTLRCWNKVTSHVLCRAVRFRDCVHLHRAIAALPGWHHYSSVRVVESTSFAEYF